MSLRCIPLRHTNKTGPPWFSHETSNVGPKLGKTKAAIFGFGDFKRFHPVAHHRRGNVCYTVDFLRVLAASAANIAAYKPRL